MPQHLYNKHGLAARRFAVLCTHLTPRMGAAALCVILDQCWHDPAGAGGPPELYQCRHDLVVDVDQLHSFL